MGVKSIEEQRQMHGVKRGRGAVTDLHGTEADLSKEDKRAETVGSKERKRGNARLMLETEAYWGKRNKGIVALGLVTLGKGVKNRQRQASTVHYTD